MSEEFGANIVSLTDEEGVDHEFEHLDTIEHNGKLYLAFVEAGVDEDTEVELIILRAETDENGEEILSSIDDEEELQAVYEAFLENEDEE
ncbi:MAG: DUF1292 domain-containing protein [Clostridia bacterium]|nr:DUF1292 domain-containing protein [Clostridia bacterium]